MKKIIAVIGARPQFIKHFAFEMEAKSLLNIVTIHTGQHYDDNMSRVFFDELGMQQPGYLMNLGGGNHGVQTGKMMIEIEGIVLKENPDAIVVYGDTNSTLAGALIASKLHIKLVHIEAGLRSFNKEMPEEINRVLTDHVSDLLFVPSKLAVENLKKEGIEKNVHNVGDIMKDLVLKTLEKKWFKPHSTKQRYYYATIHRPYNTDEKERLSYVLNSLNNVSQKVVFAIHPRTKHAMKGFGMDIEKYSNIEFIDPQGYFENLGYLYSADALITDSGGMQKEAYWMKRRCITIRKETEWLETLENGANRLIFEDLSELNSILEKPSQVSFDPTLYGKDMVAAEIVSQLLKSITN